MAEDKSRVLDKEYTTDFLELIFSDQFFDYYLKTPETPDGYYITDIAGMKVGFGSSYQLKKFILKLEEEMFTDGVIPAFNIRVRPMPEISEPVVRRLGTKVTVNETNLSAEEKRRLERGEAAEPGWTIDEGGEGSHGTVNCRPTGPMV